MIVTPGASADGSMLVAHSDDDELADQRLIHVPAADHPDGARRPVFGLADLYPRLVTSERGPGYDTPGHPPTPPLGDIPQVRHTFAYHDGNYGIMNEHHLMIGECTDGARYEPEAVRQRDAAPGTPCRIMHSEELSRIALERCTTARDAIRTMGALIERYGLFSTGETLLVADEHEAWVFEMCALPHPVHHSAWVAQQVPDGEVFVAANGFRIREVSDDRPDMMVSRFLLPGVAELGWWDPHDGPVDWARAVGRGEYCHPYYSLRRVWRVLDRVNPDLCLSPWVADGFTRYYPFSVRPRRPLTLTDVFALYRDHYEGTEFDLTQGVAAGPYGDPTRLVGPYDGGFTHVGEGGLPGAWERPISVYYQGYTYVNQVRPDAPAATRGLVWFGPDIACTTCFAPLPTSAPVPKAYSIGSPQKFDRGAAWWAFDFVANWARLNYQRMTRVDIAPRQEAYERAHLDLVRQWDRDCAGMSDAEARAHLTVATEANTQRLLSDWWELADLLIAKYSDGFCNQADPGQVRNIGYPASWLRHTDHPRGPVGYRMAAADGRPAADVPAHDGAAQPARIPPGPVARPSG